MTSKVSPKEETRRIMENVHTKIKFSRIWSMPSRWTFTIKSIKELLAEEATSGLWADPFAGYNSPAGLTNDLDPESPSKSHQDALEWLQSLRGHSVDGVLYDPPYSITQARMYGKKEYASMMYWANCKTEIARIVKTGGKVICFGWNTNGIGINREFRLDRILIVAHGGSKNDTLVTVETKL